MTYLPPVNGGRVNATIGGNTAGAGSLVSSGTLTLAGGNNITLSQNGNAITISGANSGGGIALANSQTTFTSGTANLVASGALTIASTTGQSLNFSVPQTSSLSATGMVSISTNGSTISIGAAAGSNTFGMSNIGNTSGTTGVISGSAMQYVLAGGNNITLSQSLNGSSGTVTISAASQSVQTQNLHNITLSGNSTSAGAGYIQVSSGTLTLAGGNNITLSQNGNAITISGANSGGGGIALANSQTTFTSGTANLVASGALTIASTTGQSLNFSVPQTSSVVGSGGVNISTNSNGVTVSAAPQGTLSRWEYPVIQFASILSYSSSNQGLLSMQNVIIPMNVSGTAAKIAGSIALGTSTANVTGTANISVWMGVYSTNGASGESLLLASSGSANNSFTFQGNSSASSNYSSLTGVRELTVPMNVNATPGQYWVGAVMSTNTVGALNLSFSLWGNSMQNTAQAPVLAPIGSNTASGYGFQPVQGVWKSSAYTMPTTIPFSSINNTAATALLRAAFYHAFYNTSYS
ncbi:MAG TPA: hypothetical protein VLG92_00515 [Candidatus Saccharimonadia bacterium]|nr:hypothetical protein [Candidatus Saccharimonadia bacterium]